MERAKRERGRPSGSYRIDPALVLGFMTALPATGRARNDDAAVVRLSRLGVFSYDQALHGLRAAKKEPRLGKNTRTPRCCDRPDGRVANTAIACRDCANNIDVIRVVHRQ